MSPFNPDKFRLDSTSLGGVNVSIDRKIEKLSKKCAELIQKNKHKEAKKLLEEIKELKALRLPEDDDNQTNKLDAELELDKTLITTPAFQLSEQMESNGSGDQEKTVVTAQAAMDQEKTVITPQSILDLEKQESTVITGANPFEMEKTLITTPQFNPEQEQQENQQESRLKQAFDRSASSRSDNTKSSEENENKDFSRTKNNATMVGAGACVIIFFTMAAFSYFAFKDFPGKGNYFEWLRSESVFQKAESERKQGNFKSAIKLYNEAATIYPDSAKALHEAGQVELYAGTNANALVPLEKAAQLNQKNSDYQRDYANALRLNEQGVKAFDIVSRLDQKEKNTPQNKALLGLIEVGLKQPDAETFISDAMRTQSTGANLNQNHDRDFYAGIYYRIKGEREKSLECLQRANQARPFDVRTLVEYIKAKNQLDQVAEKEAEDLTKLAPEWTASWYIKGEQMEKASKFDQAAECFAKVAKLDPNNSDRFSRLAQNYSKAGKKADAIRAAYDGLKLRNDDFNCIEVIGEADASITPEKMEELYQKALAIHPTYDQGWRGLAFWQNKSGKIMAALESQSKAVKADPENASNWYGLAVYLDHFQNKSQALRAAAEAMSLEPENEKYTELRMKLLSRN